MPEVSTVHDPTRITRNSTCRTLCAPRISSLGYFNLYLFTIINPIISTRTFRSSVISFRELLNQRIIMRIPKLAVGCQSEDAQLTEWQSPLIIILPSFLRPLHLFPFLSEWNTIPIPLNGKWVETTLETTLPSLL